MALDELYGMGYDHRKYLEAVKKVTVEDIKPVANKYFIPEVT